MKKNKHLQQLGHAFILLFISTALMSQGLAQTADPVTVLHHQLQLNPDIQKGNIQIQNRIILPEHYHSPVFDFLLGKNFSISYQNRPLKPARSTGGNHYYRIQREPGQRQIELHYQGQIPSTPACAWTRQICSLLNDKGIYLGPGTGWYPRHEDDLHTFTLTTSLPADWRSLSQGKEAQRNQWQTEHPQDAIYLMAAKFHVYEKPGDTATASVWLLEDNPQLAQRYLDATEYYLKHYSALLGDYPYSKFATVESFWESGWGMPSFTLLGSRVLRLPFILHTSFPHEILHNWWGNSVYIDSSGGNWSEGLTAYLADHALKEKAGKGMDYRRDALQKYAVFTRDGHDFPISKFRSRHNNATQAIGYSKLLMVYHMLRQQLGDETFYAGLRRFYQHYQFRYASFSNLIQVFSDVAGKDLQPYFRQWLEQTDAPTLVASLVPTNANVQTASETIRLTQQSSQPPFHLRIPLKAYRDEQLLWQDTVLLKQQQQEFVLKLPADANLLRVDPEFDVLRKPLAAELPATLHHWRDASQKQLVIKNPSVWKTIAEQLEQQQPKQFSQDKTAKTQVMLGIEDNLEFPGFSMTPKRYIIDGKPYPRANQSIALARKNADGSQQILLAAPTPDQAALLIRKLRHYGKYSYLVFNERGKNILKGQWNISDSPLDLKP